MRDGSIEDLYDGIDSMNGMKSKGRYPLSFETLWQQKGCRNDDAEWKEILYQKWKRQQRTESQRMTRNAEHYNIGMSEEDDTVPESNISERVVVLEEASSKAESYERAGEKIEVEKVAEVLQSVPDEQEEQVPKREAFEALWQQKGCRNHDAEWKEILYQKWKRQRCAESQRMTRNEEHDELVPETNEDYTLGKVSVVLKEAPSQAAIYERAVEKTEAENVVEILEVVWDEQKEQVPRTEYRAGVKQVPKRWADIEDSEDERTGGTEDKYKELEMDSG